MQMPGGHLLAAGLDGGNTKMYSSPTIRTNQKRQIIL